MESNPKKKELEKRIQAILKNLPSGSRGKEYKGYPNSIEYFRANYRLFLVCDFKEIDKKLYYRLQDTHLLKDVRKSIEAIKKARAELIPAGQNALYYTNLKVIVGCKIELEPRGYRKSAKKAEDVDLGSIDDELETVEKIVGKPEEDD